ncbi:hypothetical protein NDU88_008636 [Pleurodeles waltl]|uniref:L1 transposable element RRM domain-containing protein n=1 Tax=Pleurodeles waltl TaxID=8319 RepID=A0AAV7QV96_PLEWA|nr:hypothetical protein NDU88_008636 [Pleurodeles waltl]
MGRTKGKSMEDGVTPTPRSQNPTPQAKENMDKLDTTLKEIRDSRRAIGNRLDMITTDMNIMKDDQAKLSDRLKQTESTVADILQTHNDNKNAIVKLQQQMEALQERIEDREGCSQRNNICTIGLPEGKEGNDPTPYIESWLQSIANDRLSIHFVVERAHRVPGRKPIPGAPAGPVIARILNYRDRDVALQVARELDPIIIDNARISLYPDYALAVQKRRASYQIIKQRLRKMEIKYALLFPAKLCITHNQKTHFFDSSDLVSTWLDENFPYSRLVEQNNGHHAGQLPQHRRDKRNKAQTSQKRTGPTLRQALEGQNNALQTAGYLREINSSPCRTASSIDSIAASDSEGSMALFPDITPQLARDF